MKSEASLFALFDDLEQQAAGLRLAEREAEVGELALGEYAQVTLLGRLHGSHGMTVRVHLRGGEHLSGRLHRVGADWIQLDDTHGVEWMLRLGAVDRLTGLAPGAVSEEAWPITAGLSMRSALRAMAGTRRECVVQLLGGERLEGVLGRVGHDFVELQRASGMDRRATRQPSPGAGTEVVPLRALVSVREGR